MGGIKWEKKFNLKKAKKGGDILKETKEQKAQNKIVKNQNA